MAKGYTDLVIAGIGLTGLGVMGVANATDAQKLADQAAYIRELASSVREASYLGTGAKVNSVGPFPTGASGRGALVLVDQRTGEMYAPGDFGAWMALDTQSYLGKELITPDSRRAAEDTVDIALVAHRSGAGHKHVANYVGNRLEDEAHRKREAANRDYMLATGLHAVTMAVAGARIRDKRRQISAMRQ